MNKQYKIELGINKRQMTINGTEYEATIVLRTLAAKTAYKDGGWLHKMYREEGKTMSELGLICGVTPMCINNWLKRHNIQTRSTGARKLE